MTFIKKTIDSCQKNFVIILIVFSVFVFLPAVSRAATLYFAPDTINSAIGGDFRVDVKIDSQGAPINAAQAIVKFPPNTLKLLDVDKSSSVFNFWLDGPTISNASGTLAFTAGTSQGISGGALEVISLHFQTLGSGTAQISISNAAVTAADGSGTNVLSTIKNASVGVSTAVIPAPAVEIPQQVTRPAISSAKLPIAPVVKVSLYPDQTSWYSQVGDVVALWDLPPDVSQVSARLTQGPESNVGTPEKVLVNGKDFGVLNEGIHYIRVQFKNNIGWGPATYYKISLDTTAPLPFKIKINATSSQNPSPDISFQTSDSLSGIADYLIIVDGQQIAQTASTSLILPPQSLGAHQLTVRAVDLAGNSIEDSLQFNILPIEPPTINFYSASVILGNPIFISGQAAAMDYIESHLVNSNNQEVDTEKVQSDALGHWEIKIDKTITEGNYTISVIETNPDGASSYPTKPVQITVESKPLFLIGGIAVTQFWFFAGLILILLLIFSWVIMIYRFRKSAVGRRTVIAERDVVNAFNMINEDIGKVGEKMKKYDKSDPSVNEIIFVVNKIKDRVDKMKKYIADNIGDISQ
ncbi:MAG: cohesin domain-containing protein [Patescibacteria group bacterium]|nr:cohesin domain-containing protein [Patescibacteria group bacterium]